MRKIFLHLSLFCCTFFFSIAQPIDSLSKSEMSNDELKSLLFETFQQMKQQRIEDSIRKAELREQIELMRGGEKLKKDDLLQILQRLDKEDSLRHENWKVKIENLKEKTPGYPVAPFGDTLFLIYTKIGVFKPEERASAITEKIRKIYEDVHYHPDSLRIEISETSADIICQNMIVAAINDWDAAWVNEEKEAYANKLHNIIREAVVSEREQNSLKNWLKRAGYFLLVLMTLFLLLFLISRLFRRLARWLTQHKERYLPGFKVNGVPIISSEQELTFALKVNMLLKWVVIIATVYISLPIIFNILPFTEKLADRIIDWTLSPARSVMQSFIHYIPNLFTIIVIFLITRYVVKMIGFGANELKSGKITIDGFYPDWAVPTFNIIRFLLYAFMFVVIFPYLPGSDSPIFKGVTVFLGVLFSLGSTSAVANIVSGFVITYMRPFQIGDRIKIGDITGNVIEKSILVTRVRTVKNENVTIPNSTVLSAHTINYSTSGMQAGLILNTTVTIGYDAPWRKVHQLLMDAALATNRVLKEPKPFVLQTALNDFYVSYQINAYTNVPNEQVNIYSELHQNIQDKFNEAGVEIMSPHYRNLRDGNTSTIPADQRPKDDDPPAFRVEQKNPKG